MSTYNPTGNAPSMRWIACDDNMYSNTLTLQTKLHGSNAPAARGKFFTR